MQGEGRPPGGVPHLKPGPGTAGRPKEPSSVGAHPAGAPHCHLKRRSRIVEH